MGRGASAPPSFGTQPYPTEPRGPDPVVSLAPFRPGAHPVHPASSWWKRRSYPCHTSCTPVHTLSTPCSQCGHGFTSRKCVPTLVEALRGAKVRVTGGAAGAHTRFSSTRLDYITRVRAAGGAAVAHRCRSATPATSTTDGTGRTTALVDPPPPEKLQVRLD